MKASLSGTGAARWFCEVLRGAMLMRGLYDILLLTRPSVFVGVCESWGSGMVLFLLFVYFRWLRGKSRPTMPEWA